MRFVLTLLGALAVDVGPAARAHDDDAAWKNTSAVVTTKWAAKAKLENGDEIEVAYPVVYCVEAVGNRVHVRVRTGQDGFVEKAELVPLRDAMDLFTKGIRDYPNDADGYYRRGLVFECTGDLKAAMRDYDEAIRQNGNKAEYYLARALARRPVNVGDDAASDLAVAVRLDPKNPYAWHIRGRMRDSAGKLNEAVADQTEAFRLMPTFVNALTERANLWMRLNHLDEAIDDYTELIKLDKRTGRYYADRGKCRERKQDPGGAMTDYTAAIQLNPSDDKAFVYRGTFFYQLKEYPEAVKDLTVAVKLEPKNLVALNNLAWILATCPDDKQRDGAKALELAKTACDLGNWKAPALLGTYAAANAEMGQFDKAVEWQKKALALVQPGQDGPFRGALELYQSRKPKRD